MGCLIVTLVLIWFVMLLAFPLVMLFVTGGLVILFVLYVLYDSIL